MANRTLQVNGQDFIINRDKKAGVTQLKNNETKVQGNPFVRLGTLGSFSSTSNSFSSGTNSSGSNARVGVLLNRALTVSETAKATLTITGTVDSITAPNGIGINPTQGTTGGGSWTPDDVPPALTTTGAFTRTFSCLDTSPYQGYLQGINFSIEDGEAVVISNLSIIVDSPDINTYIVDRTAPVIDSDPVGNSRPLLGKLVGDAAVAYSLRDLNTKQGDTKAVRVRRESDNEERDFVAKDVSKIADWTNGKLETALPASPDATQTIRIEGGSEVAGVYIARSVVNNKPAYFNESLTVPTKLIFTSGNPRWIIQKQSDNSTLVNSTTTGEDEATPAAITNVATYFSGTGTKLVTSITPHYSAAAAAYSLRKVNSSHGTDIVKLASLEDARLDDLAAEYTSFGDRLTLPSGISIRNFRTSAAITASRTYTNGIVTLNVTSNGNTIAQGYQNTLRFENLTPNKRYVIKGEARVIKNTLTGTYPLASARIDINDQYNQVAIYTGANTPDWTPFSVVGDTRSSLIVNGAEYNAGSRFIDITAQAGGTNITGEVTVQYKNIQIIEDPNYVVRIRRGDNVEADVKFDSNDKLSLNSEVVNTHEDTDANSASNGVRARYDYDTGSTTARTLGDFLNPTYTVGTSVESASRTFTSFTSNGNDGFTTTKTGGGSSTGGFPYTFTTGDVISVSFDLVLADGASPTFILSGNNMGSGSVGTGTTFTSSGSYTQELTTTSGTGTHLAFTDGNTGTFTVSNFKVTSHKAEAFVNTWYNQATFNEDAYQQAATKQPKIAENGALLADGISFDGTDDFLSTSGVLTSNASASIFTKVTALTADATFTDYFYTEGYSGENGSLNETFGLGWSASGNIHHTSAATDTLLNDGLGGSLANGALVSIIGGASTTGSYVNGATLSTISTPTNASGNNTITTSGGIGGHSSTSSLGKFKMSEILIYTSDQSNNRFKIESNINNYYGLYTNAENGFVSTWYDQSGNDNHAVQSSQSKQPTIITNGSIKVSNGSPAIFFTGDARDDSLEFTDLTLTDASIFTVVNIDSSADQQLILGGSDSTATATMIPLMDNGSSSTQVYKNSTVGGAEQGSSQFKNGSAVTLADRDDAFDNLAVNSQILFTMIDVDVAEAMVLDGISRTPSNALGYHLQGLMNELIIYNSDQSNNRPAIEANINNQYQIYS